MNLVDSSAWLAYFADEPTAESFKDAIEDTELLLVPTVCLHEVFKVILRERGEDDALLAVAAMQQGMVIPLDEIIALDSAQSSKDFGLAFADSVIYATAKRYEALVWTQDAHFEKLEGVRYFPKLKR